MNMTTQSRIYMLIQHIRDARKAILVSALVAPVVGILIFLGGSYFFLFSYYEALHRSYYDAILRDVLSFQTQLIGKATYRDDMREIAGIIRRQRGVMDVWFTDRYGKLIYHTDSTILGEYRGKRLPSVYYESIEHLWEFEAGYPVMHMVALNWNMLRVSVPLYITGREEHDFIMGMDVTRFLFIPHDVRYIAIFSAGYFLIALAIMFLPFLIWIRLKFKRAEQQVRMMVDSLVPLGMRSGAISAGQAGESLKAVETEPVAQVGSAPSRPAAEVAAAPEPALPKSSPKPEKPMSEEIEQEQMLIAFLKQKRTMFAEQSLDMDFLQAHCCVLHSKGAEGSYLFYHSTSGTHMYACFSAPAKDAPGVYDTITEIAGTLKKALKSGTKASALLQGCNDYCRKKSMSIDVSLIIINEKERNVEYTCSGTGVAFYLKDGEESVKELRLSNPGLGKLSKDKFTREISSADIKLTKNDLFSLLPLNASEYVLEDESLDALIRSFMVQNRALAASELGGAIVRRFESLYLEKKNLLPETGFVILKFR